MRRTDRGLIWFLSWSCFVFSNLPAAAFGGAEGPLVEISYRDLPSDLLEGDLEVFKEGIRRQLPYCGQLQGMRQFGTRRVSAKDWCTKTSKAFLSIANKSKNWKVFWRKARNKFDWFKSRGRDGKGEVFYTGYYSPLIEASREPSSEYSAPLYRKPADLVRVEIDQKKVWRKKNSDNTYSMHYTREEIEEKRALEGQGLEIAYLKGPFDTFVFQVQGAGKVRIRSSDGRVKTEFLNYSAQNGHPYVSVGRVMRDMGVPKEYLSLPGMRRYFEEYPDQLQPILSKNASYVYFSETDDGPYGSKSVILSGGHSVATDHSVFPFGAIGMIQTVRPIFDKDQRVKEWKPFSRLILNQDVGGAIRGPGRVDVFWGEDQYAELAAGHLQHLGTLYFAIAK